jgi:GTPase SAR1 family protein
MAKIQQTTQFDQSQKIRLGIWGPPSSGKTVYMTMLSHYLKVAESSPWKVEITDKSTIEFVTKNLSLIRTKGEFMGGTEIRRNEQPKLYSYKLKHKNRITNDVELNFFDLPGEYYLGGDHDGIENESGRKLSIAQHLNQCHGILFLLSPLDEDRSRLKGSSYYDLLEKLFMNMQSLRQSMSPELEQYVAFCITKVDHQQVYEEYCKLPATKSFLKLLGNNASLNWFQNFFHVDINSRKQELTPEPSQYNRCQFFYISPFGVYRDEENNTTRSPVFEEKTDDKPTSPDILQKPDPIFQELNPKADPYESIPVGIPSYDGLPDKNSKIYKIDTEKKFSPINVLTPIQWLLKGIEHHPPSLSPMATMAEEENQNEDN